MWRADIAQPDRVARRLEGTPDGSRGGPFDKYQRPAMGGAERLALALLEIGLDRRALGPAAALIAHLDLAARERAIVADHQQRSQHA
jgi:hypothetical protein